MKQLSGLDALFFHLEGHGLPMHISSLAIFDPSTNATGKLEFDDIRQAFNTLLVQQVPVMRCRLKLVPYYMDQPYWVNDDDFDIDLHLHHVALPKPADWSALYKLCADIHAKPLDRSRALWEAWIIDGLDNLEGVPNGCYGLFLKVHHSIMDGHTAIKIITTLYSLEPGGQSIATANPADQQDDLNLYQNPNRWQMMTRSYRHNLQKTWGMTKLLTNKLPKTLGKLEVAKFRNEIQPIGDKVRTRFNQRVSPQRTINRITMPLAELKAIKNTVPGATINDTVLTIIGGALQDYLHGKKELPASSLIATNPVDIRTENDADKPGNIVSGMNVAIGTDIADPLERLKQVSEASKAAKAFSEMMGHYTIYDAFQSVYSSLAHWGIKSALSSDILDRMTPLANTTVTNLPSIPLQLYMAGAKLLDCFGIGPVLPHMGLFHAVTGINGQICICFTACAKAIPDGEEYARCLQDSYQELKYATIEKRPKHKVVRKKKAHSTAAKKPRIPSAKTVVTDKPNILH